MITLLFQQVPLMIKFVIFRKKGPLLFIEDCLNFIGFCVENLLSIVVLHLYCDALKCVSLIALFSINFYFPEGFLETILSSSNPNPNIICQSKSSSLPYMRLSHNNFRGSDINIVQVIHR